MNRFFLIQYLNYIYKYIGYFLYRLYLLHDTEIYSAIQCKSDEYCVGHPSYIQPWQFRPAHILMQKKLTRQNDEIVTSRFFVSTIIIEERRHIERLYTIFDMRSSNNNFNSSIFISCLSILSSKIYYSTTEYAPSM